eukprot:1160919-Pelagomonas_calceolata.AAC.7
MQIASAHLHTKKQLPLRDLTYTSQETVPVGNAAQRTSSLACACDPVYPMRTLCYGGERVAGNCMPFWWMYLWHPRAEQFVLKSLAPSQKQFCWAPATRLGELHQNNLRLAIPCDFRIAFMRPCRP